MQVRLAPAAFDPGIEEGLFAVGRTDMGAMVRFVGLCRAHTDGRAVAELFLDHLPGFTEREIGRIAADVSRRCRCPDLLVVHRVGKVLPGEPIVLVAALSEHRAQAFEAVRLLMDYLKTDAPFWKKEVGPDGTVRWIEPRDSDRAARLRAEGEVV
jgi:molybdopterin synthase catalytic subunit